MDTIFFWIVWAVISLWALRTFYFSFTNQKLECLRKTAFGINLFILAFGLFPLISAIGVKNGFESFSTVNALAFLFTVFLFTSTAFFLTTSIFKLKFASILNIINTFSYLGVMYGLRPETFILTLSDALPVIAALLLLINNVVVLLLWQQLQLKGNKKLNLKKSSKWSIVIFLIFTLSFGWFVYQKNQPPLDDRELGVKRVLGLKEVQEFKKAVEENNGRSKFNIVVAAEPTKENSFYLIQVFEVFPDHRTTFKWYRYYPDTKKVFTQFLERATTDNWDEAR